MKEKFYIIDGSGYIFRAYYGVQQPLSTKAGLPTNALYGFTKMFLGLLDKVVIAGNEPPTIVVIFDAARKNFRHEIYPEYKANRAECPEDLVPQMPYFRTVASALGFPVLEKVGFEADDLIATLVSKMKSEDKDVVIVSADKDLTQLVEDGVTMWDPMRDKVFDDKEVFAHFGVKPSQIGDYLSIVGDASDNIPGAKGVGPKTVAQLFQEFSDLDDLLSNLDKVSTLSGLRGAKGVQAKLESNIDLIRLSRTLVALDHNVELDSLTLQNIDSKWSGYRDEELKALISDLEFESLFKKFSLKENPAKAKEVEQRDYKVINLEELRKLLSSSSGISEIAFDTETDSLDPLVARLMGISFSWESEKGYYLPLNENNMDRAFLSEALEPIFKNSSILKFGSNLKFDLRILKTAGIEVKGPFFDTMVAAQILTPGTRENGLKSLALKHLNERMVTFEEMISDSESIHSVPLERLGHYAAHDADASLRIGRIFNSQLKDDQFKSQEKLFFDVEMPVLPVLAKMEQVGIKINEGLLSDLEVEFSTEAERLNAEIMQQAGEDFNLNSPKQLSVVLFEKLGLPVNGVKKGQSGYSTDAGVLQRLQGTHPIIENILEYREVHKLLTTYIQGLKKLVHPKTGRIHTSFNQAITATGRLSSTDPNLQNIPIRSERGRRIRELFVAKEGSKLIIADYSQVELRVLAHLSKDENLIEAFRSGEDIHLRTARELFGEQKALGDEASSYRRVAKTINFGIIYGMGPFRLAGDLGVSRREAQDFIDAYFNRYPKVKVYFDSLEVDGAQKGYVETLFGRRRYLEEVSGKGRDKGYAVRSMMNAPIQGSAAEIVKLAMINIDREIQKSPNQLELLLQVHDELICEVKEEFAQIWADQIKASMEGVLDLLVPLKADVIVGNNWGQKK